MIKNSATEVMKLIQFLIGSLCTMWTPQKLELVSNCLFFVVFIPWMAIFNKFYFFRSWISIFCFFFFLINALHWKCSDNNIFHEIMYDFSKPNYMYGFYGNYDQNILKYFNKTLQFFFLLSLFFVRRCSPHHCYYVIQQCQWK